MDITKPSRFLQRFTVFYYFCTAPNRETLYQREFRMTTENQSEKRPKLTLGLKKKTEGDQSKTTEGHSRLTLGLRNKAATI
jgi:hypothetical protein